MTFSKHPTVNSIDQKSSNRKQWLARLALSPVDQLEAFYTTLSDAPSYDVLRPPEIGMAMVQGRAGGTGNAFNLGEMTIARCVVTIADSQSGEKRIGVGYVSGRDRRQAELVAFFDACFQDSGSGSAWRNDILPALEQTQNTQSEQKRAKTAATKVDFFTMDRGR